MKVLKRRIKLKIESNSYIGIIMEKCWMVQKNEFIRSGGKMKVKGQGKLKCISVETLIVIHTSKGKAKNI